MLTVVIKRVSSEKRVFYGDRKGDFTVLFLSPVAYFNRCATPTGVAHVNCKILRTFADFYTFPPYFTPFDLILTPRNQKQVVSFPFSNNSPYLCRPNFRTMLAVVKIAGKQFRVQKDQTLYVPQVAGNAGDKVEFAEVLLFQNDNDLTTGADVKATVKAEILGHVKGDKVIAFKMKRRKGYRKKHGHRTHYTKIRINEIA